jgi:hypothetical protein
MASDKKSSAQESPAKWGGYGKVKTKKAAIAMKTFGGKKRQNREGASVDTTNRKEQEGSGGVHKI